MQTVTDFLDNFNKIDLPFEIESSMIDRQEMIVKEQQDQMFAGIRGDGEDINPLHGRYKGYADFTIQEKQRKGKIYQWVTLNETGEFYRGIFIDVRSDVFILDSSDDKTEILLTYYGPEIFGLTDESIEDIREPLNITLIENIEKRLQ